MEMTLAEAEAVITLMEELYRSAVPAGHLGIRVIDLVATSIVQDVCVVDTPNNREDMRAVLLLTAILPPHYLVLTNLA